MTKFKKCDDCGTVLKTGNSIKLKTSGGFGEGKSLLRHEGQGEWRERPSIIFLCRDCYNYHHYVEGNENEIKLGSSLDKIVAKHSDGHKWKKSEKMEEMRRKFESINQQ